MQFPSTIDPLLRPREKLMTRGVESLTDVELLAAVFGTGQGNRTVMQLAESVCASIDSSPSAPTIAQLTAISGLGPAKSCSLLAAYEFVRRRLRPKGTVVRNPEDVARIVSHLADRKQEHLCCLSLNGAHELIATRVVTIGLVNFCHVHPREILCDPVTDRACSVVLAHNHPSGNTEPSSDDLKVTKRIGEAAALLGIPLLDHVVFSFTGFVSLRRQHPSLFDDKAK